MKKLLPLLISSSMIFADLPKPTADVAILIDTSGSMQSLITQVRDGLWKTLNKLSGLKKDNLKADVRLALYEYGNTAYAGEERQIRLLAPLTTDHSKVAEVLFKTVANGGDELVGTVIEQATRQLRWSENLEDFRSIIIAGNETIHQGEVAPLDAAKNALESNVIVNSIFANRNELPTPPARPCRFFCPTPGSNLGSVTPSKVAEEWKELATQGGGDHLEIDAQAVIEYIKSPFDERIVEITKETLLTYIPFGQNGQSEYNRMRDLDRQISQSGHGSYMDFGNYRSGNFGISSAAKWDLVSFFRTELFNLSKVDRSTLEVKYRELSDEELLIEIEKMSDKRFALEEEAKVLREKREIFVETERQRRGTDQTQNFSKALSKILVDQLATKGFSL